MAKWLRRHWAGAAGATLAAWPILSYALHALEWAEHIDFVANHMTAAATMWNTLWVLARNYPDVPRFLAFFTGLALIALDYRTVKDPPKLEQGDWRDTWGAIYKFCGAEDYRVVAVAVDNVNDNARLRRELEKKIINLNDPQAFGGRQIQQLQFELNRAKVDADHLDADCAAAKRAALSGLISKLAAGHLTGKAFRKPYSESDTMRLIPAEHWNVLQFDVDDPLLQTVYADDVTYGGLLIKET